MSYDLAVWLPNRTLSDEDAIDRFYEAMGDMEEGDGGDDVDAALHPEVDLFYEELTSIHPELSVTDGPGASLDDEECPWAATFERGPGLILLYCVPEHAEYCDQFVRKLALKHGLCMFNLQTDRLSYSVRPKPTSAHDNAGASPQRPWWKFWG